MIIYKITNILNNKSYVGQTIRSIEKRWAQHCSNKEQCVLIHQAICKYGKNNFIVEQIDSATSLEELNKKETEHILSNNTLSPNGYNLNTGGGNRRWSEESKQRMSQSHSGKTLDEEHKKNISISVKKVFSENPEKLDGARKALKAAGEKWKKEGYHPKRGKKLSDKARKNIADAKIGSKNPMFGKKLNEKQMSAIKAGQEKRLKNLPSVLCHQNGKIYPSVIEAAADLGLKRPSVSGVLTGFRKSCYGHTFKYVKKDGSDE